MIDINTLTIGSHVLFNGERVEVIAIDDNDCVASIVCEKGYVQVPELHPIPITEELLTELGFEKQFDEGFDMWYKGIENPNTLLGHSVIRVLKLSTRWEVQEPPCYAIPVRYLHELEAFIYLTTKQHLI